MSTSWPSRLALIAASCALFASTLAVLADEATSRREALHEAQEPLRAKRWGDAVASLRAFRQAHPDSPEAVEAWVLEARALLRAGAPREALEATSAFLARHGETAWAGRMKHTAAEAYAALSAPKEAADALRERVEATTSEEARAAIGALHVALADEDFDGVETTDDLGRKTKKRDVARALTTYRHAREVGLPAAETLRVRERIAQCLEEVGQVAEAAAAWGELLADVGHGKVVADDEMHERWLVGRGRAHLAAEKLDEARKDLRDALERHPQGKLHMEVLLLLGEERLKTADRSRDDVAFEEGVTWIRRAILEHRQDSRATAAQRRLADAYEARGQSEKAAAEWAALIERFPDDETVPEARDRRAQALVRAGRFDDAIAEWERFLASHPNHPLWPTVREKIAAAAFQKGEAARLADDLDGAVAAWQAFAERFPTDARAPVALNQAGAVRHAQKSFDTALGIWRQVSGRYAASPQAADARLAIGTTLDGDLGRLDDAVQAYEEVIAKHPGTGAAQQAQARLQELKAKRLDLRMDRVHGTAEKPTLRVTSRNIPKLEVRVYKLEMEEYFRRKGTVLGVENLQLEVVKPDATAQWVVDGYAPFQLFEGDRELPVKGPGAFVVVVGDEDLTATVLFLVSDVEVVVKESRGRDLLVWAFERQGQAPVAGARVLAAQGGRVVELGVTGADGIWQGQKGGDADHVLVLSEKGMAASGLEAGPAVASGFQSKAYVYTDRPVYRPGQEVHWRAIFLAASGGSYVPPTVRKGTVLVRDARGQTLLEREVESSPFGAFDGSFPVDGEAPLGTWTVQLSVPKQGSWTGTFAVQAYRKPELTVSLYPKQPVCLTGEKVEAVARVTYAFGGPVSGAPLRYEIYRTAQLFEPSPAESYAWYLHEERRDDETRRQQARGTLVARGETHTDDQGEALLSFETAERDEDALYVVRVAVEDVTRRWIGDEGSIPVTRRDHMAAVSADRKVYRPKQEMRVEVRTMDALEQPVSRSGELLLLELRRTRTPPGPTRRGGRPVQPVTEQEVELVRYPLTTGSNGTGEVRLQMPGPGRWRLRWRATDGRGALVTAYVDVEASGEAEDLSRDARLVAARRLVTEGEDAEVLLQSPVTGVRALLTYEGERVLGYRFLDVSGRSTLLALPVGAEHAPNVFFAVAIPGPGRLLEATTEVIVLRTLQVEVDLPRTAHPGEKVEVRVKTTDARGRPVPAEVGVALIDETLYAIAPDRAGAIRPYFYDRRRMNGIQTFSSLGFQALGTTRQTNKDLLADEAVRSGDAGRALAAAALDQARAALERGDTEAALRLALRSLEADPGSFEGRRFFAELESNPAIGRLLADNRVATAQSATRLAALEERMKELKDAQGGVAGRPAASPTPLPAAKARFADKKGEVADSLELEESAADDEDLEVANEAIGLGGGAGGAFRGRGGRRSLSAHGGGRIAAGSEPAQDWAGGVVMRASGDGPDAVRIEQLQRQLAAHGLDLGLTLEVRKNFADTAHWAPHVVTDETGEARLEVELPDNLTTWRAVVRGVSGQALVGEGRGRLPSRKDLLVRIDAPRFLVQTDQVTVPVAVHNETGDEADVRSSAEVEGMTWDTLEAQLRLPDGGRGVLDREGQAPESGRARLEASATAGAAGDRTEVGLSVLPRGIRQVEGRSGVIETARGDVQATFLDVPELAVQGATRLAVVLYPGIDQAVLDALLALDLYPYGCVEQTVHRFLPALAARDALRAAASPAAARLDRLDEAIRRGALRLRNLQNDDGSFGWFRGGRGDLAMTAYGLLGLVGAQQAGVPDLETAVVRARDALNGLLAAGTEDSRALGHLALARAGAIAEEAWASTFRRRNDDLSVPGLAWMAMAAQAIGRTYDRDDLVRLLLQRRVDEGETTHWAGAKGDCFVGSDREATGLAVQALLVAGGDARIAERGLAWLLAHAPDGTWGTTKETAAFVLASSAWVREHGAQGYGGRIDVLLDENVVRQVTVGREGLEPMDRRFLVDAASDLEPGRHRLAFRLEGQGRLRWAVRLETVVRSEDLPAEEHGLAVVRQYLRPEVVPVEGQPAPTKPGYEVLRPAARPRLEAQMLERVNAGDRVLVRLEVQVPRDLAYVLVEDPLPAGFEVLEGTVEGPFDWQERRDDRQVFFLSSAPKGTHVLRYVLQATHWGRFTALGTTASPMYLPEVHGRAAGHVLTIQREPLGETDAEHAPTPDEIWARAKDLFEVGRRDEATALLRGLRDEQPLRDEVLEELEAYLLQAALQADDAREIVRAREALVRRNAARIPNDWATQREIAFAYHELGEVEVASSLYRDLVARAFGLRTNWTRTLTDRGREAEGLDTLGLALASFPISNATADAALRRALRYREVARPEGREGQAGRPMDAEALDSLFAFTAHYADTPLADLGNYATIGALRQSGDLVGAQRAAEAFLERFPKSVWEDDAWYFLAEARYQSFEKDPSSERGAAVLAAAKPLVERSFPDGRGKDVPSEFRSRAFHLMGRVAHVQGDLEQALRLYWQAREIEDAREAHAFLTEERLHMPATEVVGLAEDVAVPVSYQNVAELALKAYPVDLPTLFAVRKTLEGLHDIDLSGIVPKHAWTHRFEGGKDHLTHEAKVPLPVEAGRLGAWLVVAKAGDQEAKALVIRTDLRVEVQRLDDKVRVYVTDAAGRPVREAYVVVSDGSKIRARGLTDGRGVFEAPGVGASAAVVVSKDDRYAVGR